MSAPTGAVVFDCDGLLLDTEPIWEHAERAFIVELGGIWSPHLRNRTLGRSVPESARLLAEEAGARLPGDRATDALVRHFERAAFSAAIPLMPGAATLLERLAGAGVPLAVASNSPSPVLARLLRRAGVVERFAAVVAAGDGLAPKPSPDVYLAACARLGVARDEVHALEDSQPGVDAALAAGVGVTGVNSDHPLRGCRQVASLNELSPGALGIGDDQRA